MEKELLETFAAAKRAADALDGGGGKAEADRCIDALERLQRLPVTVNDLVATQVGKSLRGLTKNRHEKIKAVASDLLKLWKDLVVQETTRADNRNNTPRNPSRADNRNSSPRNHSRAENGNNTPRNPSRADEISNVGVVKSEDRNGIENTKENAANGPIGSKAGAVKAECLKGVENNTKKSSSGPVGAKAGAVQPEGLNRVENNMTKPSSAPICPPKLNSVPKCNIPVRDRLREVLAEAFSRVSRETRESKRDEVRNIWDEVDARDPVRAAVTVESAMFEKLGASTGAHKVKYRSIMFNLKDGKNPDFRRRVLLGQIDPEDLGDMTPEEMASDERKCENRQIKEKALFECERGAAPKATTDQFKCGRCGQRKTTYYQLQTRSADEPMTTFVTCVNCNNHWKFC